MSFGAAYSAIYDGLYESKPYAGEAAFVLERLTALLGREPARLLDFGCGTGRHAAVFAAEGVEVAGVDLSSSMIAEAERQRAALQPNVAARIVYSQGDIRTADLGRTFDAVVSLFHVMSYMAEPGDLTAALKAARKHLKPGGVVLFDFWYGPAVLADPPEERRRIVTDPQTGAEMTRRTLPSWEKEHNRVRIRYVLERMQGATQEEHVVRYFFDAEIEACLRDAGFRLAELHEWMTSRAPSQQSFGVYAAGIAQ